MTSSGPRIASTLLLAASLGSAVVAAAVLALALALERAAAFDLVAHVAGAAPLRIDVLEREAAPAGGEIRRLRLGDGTASVEALVRVPAGAGPFAALVVMGGLGTGRDAVHLVPGDAPYVVAALDYAYSGPERTTALGFLRRLPSIWNGVLRTTVALRDLHAHVRALPEVGAAHLLGASLGVPIAAAVAGARRVDGLVLLHGFSDHAALIERRIEPWVGAPGLRRRVGLWGAKLTAGMDAARALPRACGTPVLVVEAEADADLPASSRAALWEATCAPRQRVALPGAHVRPRRDEVLAAVIEVIRAWLDSPSGS